MSVQAPEPLAVIAVKGVFRRYASGSTFVDAVSDLSFQVRAGECIALTGPSGSGKTTLLNLIAGLDEPTAGEIWVLGTRLGDLSESRLTSFRARSIGLVFQEPQLLPGLTALENVVAGRLPWAHWSVLEPDARALLEAVGLAGRVDFPPARLSAGERQRVGIARALLGKPAILLADEPSGNLDLQSTEDVLRLLQDLRMRMSLTMITATHDPAVAASADRILRLVGGAIAEDSASALDGNPPLEVRQLEP